MGIINFDPTPGKRPEESYSRDWIFNNNDNFFAAFDTYYDQTNGFTFGVNAAGLLGKNGLIDHVRPIFVDHLIRLIK